MRAVVIILCFLIKIICLVPSTQSNEVNGCGGFIKSHAEIDFSKVEIKLLTKQGALKDKTDCSPSNGYYFLPIYDNGEYLLSIAPPPGWSFEPQQVALNFDGKNDMCSQGKDVNFVFKGFGITGKVSLAGGAFTNGGARGVSVSLHSENGSNVRHTKTDMNGVFSFTPIIPGRYVVRATHPEWHFSKAEHTVIVESGNTVLPENSLVVSGFNIVGRFPSYGQMTANIGVALFGPKGQAVHCENRREFNIRMPSDIYDGSLACYAAIDPTGNYIFRNIAPGRYLLVPVNEHKSLKLHLTPSFIEVEVVKDSVAVQEQFKITGLTVSGQVLGSPNGTPIAGAVVKLNGEEITRTNANGTYTLENLNLGTHIIKVELRKLQFDAQQVTIDLGTHTLPTIMPVAYAVCGKVISEKSYDVGIVKLGAEYNMIMATKFDNGIWCTFLKRGRYIVEVQIPYADKKDGVQFYPVIKEIDVRDTAMEDIIFSQLRAEVVGEILCLPDAPKSCTEAEVTLSSMARNRDPADQKTITRAKQGKYIFSNVLPGAYDIRIAPRNLCFDSINVVLHITTDSVTVPAFKHTGYEVAIITSHSAVLNCRPIGDNVEKGEMQSFKLSSGENKFCVGLRSSYEFKIESCHLYDDTLPSKFTTLIPDEQIPLVINAVAHKVGVRVLLKEQDLTALKLIVDSPTKGKDIIIPKPEPFKIDGKYAYRYDFYLKPEESVQITPQSDELLFAPHTKTILGRNDCVDIAFSFVAVRGLILRGNVMPPIEDVKITLSYPKNADIPAETTFTNISGEFKFGPIDERLAFALTAEKESYVFSSYNRDTATFSAHKLCEIMVKVRDDSGKPLTGVLLSLSGSESYRKNLITSDDGNINFKSLSPAQYFLRPMMKEYKFEPNSKMIEITDGETAVVELIGKRYAYSVFGTITSLNGDPFGKANIVAIADEVCMHQQEEAVSEANGKYRLRGLQPACRYTIRAKSSGETGHQIERTIPASRDVIVSAEDIYNVDLVAISPATVVDVTARVTTSHNDQYKTLRILLYRRGASDAPIYSQRVQSPLDPKSDFNPGIMVVFPRIPLDGKTYVVELQSTLSEQTYTYKLPVETFVANHSSIFIELDFRPELRVAETDINQNSISALVLVALVAIAFFRQDLAMDFMNFMWDKVNQVTADLAQRQKNNAKKDARKNEPVNQREIEQMAEQINAIKKKKVKKI